MTWRSTTIRRLAIVLRSLWNASDTKDSTNGKKLIGTPRIWKPNSSVRKFGRHDINWSNPYGDHAKHFVGCTKSLNAINSSCNHKKGTTSKAWPTMCISSTNEGKTQVGWSITIGWGTQKWVSANNTPPKGSPFHVLDSNEMIVGFPYFETSKKCSENGCV